MDCNTYQNIKDTFARNRKQYNIHMESHKTTDFQIDLKKEQTTRW